MRLDRPLPKPTLRDRPAKVRIGPWLVRPARDGYDKKRRIRVRRCEHCEDWLPICAYPWYRSRHDGSKRRRGVCAPCRQWSNAEALAKYRDALQKAKKQGK